MKISRIYLFLLVASVLTAGSSWSDPIDEEMIWDALMSAETEQFFSQVAGDRKIERKRVAQKRRMANEDERMRKRKHLEQFRLLKLLEIIDLDETQEVGFIRAFRQMRRNRQELEVQRRELLQELKFKIGITGAPSDEIYKLSEDLVRSDEKISGIRRRFVEEIRPLLSPNQFGRLILFMQRFDTELLEAARSIRRQHEAPGR